jgi:hypothetical protein
MSVVQNPCGATQQWMLDNGYYTISQHEFADHNSSSGGAFLQRLFREVQHKQQWHMSAFFRGVDNALLERQEAARIATGVTWWKEGEVQTDAAPRIRASTWCVCGPVPPYSNPSQTGCTANLASPRPTPRILTLLSAPGS